MKLELRMTVMATQRRIRYDRMVLEISREFPQGVCCKQYGEHVGCAYGVARARLEALYFSRRVRKSREYSKGRYASRVYYHVIKEKFECRK